MIARSRFGTKLQDSQLQGAMGRKGKWKAKAKAGVPPPPPHAPPCIATPVRGVPPPPPHDPEWGPILWMDWPLFWLYQVLMTEGEEDVRIDKLWVRAVNEEVHRTAGACSAADIHKVRVATSSRYTLRNQHGLFVKDVKLLDGIAAWSKEVSVFQ